MFKLLVLFAVLGVAYPKEFIVVNRHSQTVWVGTLGNAGKPAPENGGFVLGPGEQKSINTDDSWAGRFWPRTGCSDNGHCETGDCGNKLQCAGAGGVPPASLAEFTLNGYGGQDFYDVSLVDGFNLGVEIQPVHNGQDGGNRFRCGVAGCSNNLNPGCPNNLRVTNGAGQVVACKNSSPSYFKSNCPNAYSYDHDDKTSTYTCNDGSYRITFY